VIGILGGVVYRVDAWRRAPAGSIAPPLTVVLPD
jgi:hypothetical protein